MAVLPFFPPHPTNFFTRGLEFVAHMVVVPPLSYPKAHLRLKQKVQDESWNTQSYCTSVVLFRIGRKVFRDFRGS